MAEFPDCQLEFPGGQEIVFPAPEQQDALFLQITGQHIQAGHHLLGLLPRFRLCQSLGIAAELHPFTLEDSFHFFIDPLPGLLMDPFSLDLFRVPSQPVDPLEGLGGQFQFFFFSAQFSHILVPHHLTPGNGHSPPLPVPLRTGGQLPALVDCPALAVQDGETQPGMEEAVPILAVPRQQPGAEQDFHPEESEKRRPQDEFTPEEPGDPQDVGGNIASIKQNESKREPQLPQADFFFVCPPAQPSVRQKQLGQIAEEGQVISGSVRIDIPVGIGTGPDPEHQLMPVIRECQRGEDKIEDQETFEPQRKGPVLRGPVAGIAHPDSQEDQKTHAGIKAVPQEPVQPFPPDPPLQDQPKQPDAQPNQPDQDAPPHGFPCALLENPFLQGPAPQDHYSHHHKVQDGQQNAGPDFPPYQQETFHSLQHFPHGPPSFLSL